jgi:6-methylsalicylate decarboxylase
MKGERRMTMHSDMSRRTFLSATATAATGMLLMEHGNATGQIATPSNSHDPTRRQKPMIDVHSHYLPTLYRDSLRRAGIETIDGFPWPDTWTAEKHLAMMDENKIATCVLSISSPGLRYSSSADAVSLARDINEFGAGLIAAHPKRFGVDALLPMPDVDASLKEIGHSLDVLKLDGIGLYTNYQGVYLGDSKFRPVLEELSRRKATVFVHPVEPPNFGEISVGFPGPMLEYPFETTRMVASLVRGGVLKDLPEIRWITAHGGGAIPFLARQRMAVIMAMQLGFESKNAGKESTLTPKEIIAQIATLHFDVTAATTEPYLFALQALVPTSQLLAGFDFPFMPKSSIGPAVHALLSYKEYGDADREAIFNTNASALYPRLAP